ncbi:hypothetical protein [Filomicrobium sp.]|uniref:hypothetical protein n=1 Tax=Filomicrobium sp. TaxID=2024831 RepID=UPI00258CAB7B|nr:hypothetical protein [Filomicrobium sp.]MCV0371735.1 DNA-packaging protein [Filomicrobium sp.]
MARAPKAQSKKPARAKKPAAKRAAPKVEKPQEEKRGRGRPSKYDPSFCELAIELGEQGKSKTQIACAMGVIRETLDDWSKAHPEFSVAIRYAKQLEQAWWEDRGQRGISLGKDFNASAFCFQMKNRFREDYRDTQKVELSGDASFAAMLQRVAEMRTKGAAA